MTSHPVSNNRGPLECQNRCGAGRIRRERIGFRTPSLAGLLATIMVTVTGCGGFAIPGVTERQASSAEPSVATATLPTTSTEPSIAPPTTVAATVASTAAPATTAPTAPPTKSLPSTPITRSVVSTPATVAPRRVSDWYNHTYRTSCEDIQADSLTFVDGEASPDNVRHYGWAKIIDVFDAGNAQAVVQIHCDVSSAVNFTRVLLMNSDGTVVDDHEVWGESIGDLTFREGVQEGWEQGTGPDSAASTRDVTFSVANGRLVKNAGVATPKCAYVGFVADPDPSYSNGYLVNGQGELVRLAQQRLIALGYGGPIEATGGADGYVGIGTMLAIELFHGNIAGDDAWRSILDETSNEPYDPFAVLLDVDEVRNIGVGCAGEYKW